jgi:tRNA (guanine37-N1)-methyltransferase
VKFDIVTIFPRMVCALLEEGILARVVKAGRVDVAAHDLRDFTTDRHHVVDDVAFGGGPGMVLKPEPIFRAIEHLRETRGVPDAVILPSPQGRRLTHEEARRLSSLSHLVVICGRYEGIDERVRDALATDEISIGDYVVSGGELPAMVMIEAVLRWIPGVLGRLESAGSDSFATGLLDYPRYTRPAVFEGLGVPEVVVSGDHAQVENWRFESALERTRTRRPGLLDGLGVEDVRKRFLGAVRQAARTKEREDG